MATLVLALAAGAAASSAAAGSTAAVAFGLSAAQIGLAAGSLVGTIIDQAFLFPAVFGTGQQDITGPRIDDVQVMTGSEGSEIKEFIGPNNRLAGTMIWAGNVQEVRKSSGGGKGGGGSVSTFTYYQTAAVALGRKLGGGAITEVLKVWADDKVLYAKNNANEVTASTQISFEAITNKGRMKIISPSGGPDLKAVFEKGIEIVVTGASNAGNNGTFKLLDRIRKSDGETRLRVENPDAVTESAGASVTITQTILDFSPKDMDDIRFYLGSDSQDPDPFIEAVEGAGNVPAYRGTVYVVMERLKITTWGNRFPQIRALVQADAAAVPMATAISRVLLRAGRAVTDFDITAVASADTVQGYQISGPTSATEILEPMLLAGDLGVQERDGSLIFFDRADQESITVLENDLAVTDNLRDGAPTIEIIDDSGVNLPSQVNVSYLDVDQENLKGQQREARIDVVTDVVNAVDIPLVMTADSARGIAQRLLWDAWSRRQHVNFSLGPKYYRAIEGDIASLTVAGSEHAVRITRADWGQNFVTQYQGVIEETSIATASVTTEANDGFVPSDDVVDQVPVVETVIINAGPLRDQDADSLGVYVAVFATDGETNWPGVVLFTSIDDVSYVQGIDVPEQAVAGECLDALGDGPTAMWDEINTVDVVLADDSATLSSATAVQVLNGSNWAYINGEVIAFRTATLINTRTYRLSNLLRGLRDTWDAVATHVSNETFVLLDDVGINHVPMDLASFNVTKYIKGVPDGGDASDFDAESAVIDGTATNRPFPPTHITGMRDGSSNLTIGLVRATRQLVRVLQLNGVPMDEPDEMYEADVLSGAGGSVLRTLSGAAVTLNGDNTADISYTAAQQTTDGLTPGDPVVVKVYQVSGSVGRSKSPEWTV